MITTLLHSQRELNQHVRVAVSNKQAFERRGEGTDGRVEEGDGEGVDVNLLLEFEMELVGEGKG
jgi:hypothetical protein